jgi:uncharacterized protein (UPF0262 family)
MASHSPTHASKPPATAGKRARGGGRLIAVELDEASIARTHDFIEAERAIAIRDLVAENAFRPANATRGDFRLRLSVADDKLVLDIADAAGRLVARHVLSFTPFARVVKDYFLICESYYAALRAPSAMQIEAIDIGRRATHNEGAEALRARLAGKIDMDFATARRLFTLLCALRWKG